MHGEEQCIFGISSNQALDHTACTNINNWENIKRLVDNDVGELRSQHEI